MLGSEALFPNNPFIVY